MSTFPWYLITFIEDDDDSGGEDDNDDDSSEDDDDDDDDNGEAEYATAGKVVTLAQINKVIS